jgi:hypothetical protein
MAKKNASNTGPSAAGTSIAVDTHAQAQATIGNLSTDPLPVTKVNNANLGEIKSALDDAVKKVRPSIVILLRRRVLLTDSTSKHYHSPLPSSTLRSTFPSDTYRY